MPPKATRALGDPRAIELEAERGKHRRNVLVEALGDLVGAEVRGLRKFRHQEPAHEFARLAVLLAVIEEEVLQRQPRECCRR